MVVSAYIMFDKDNLYNWDIARDAGISSDEWQADVIDTVRRMGGGDVVFYLDDGDCEEVRID